MVIASLFFVYLYMFVVELQGSDLPQSNMREATKRTLQPTLTTVKQTARPAKTTKKSEFINKQLLPFC